MKEKKVKEIYEKLKSSKSKKRKLDLIRECKNTLNETIENGKMTVLDAEDAQYKTLKDKVKLERKLRNETKESARVDTEDDRDLLIPRGAKKMTSEDDWGAGTPEEDKVEFDEDDKVRRCPTEARNLSLNLAKTSENLRGATRTKLKTTRKMTPAKQKMTRPGVVKNSPVARNMVKKLNLMNLPCVKSMAAQLNQDKQQPPYLSLHSARVCGKLASVNKITKPSFIFSSVGVQNQVVQQWTGPFNQWEESRGLRQGSILPIDQSEQARYQSRKQIETHPRK